MALVVIELSLDWGRDRDTPGTIRRVMRQIIDGLIFLRKSDIHLIVNCSWW